VSRLRVDPPLAAKVRTEPGGGRTLWLVGSGASLLEGDELAISLRLHAGASLSVRSVASQLVHPCPDGGSGAIDIDVELDTGASLCWWPEPVLVAAGGRLRSRTNVRCAGSARLRWCDELVLGRSGERHHDVGLDTAVAVDVEGRPAWRDGLSSAPGWTGPAGIGTARYVGSLIRIGPHVGADGEDAAHPAGHAPTGAPGAGRPGADPDPWDSGWLPLAAGGLTRRILATDPAAGRAVLAAG